jgi:hypothetical protein
MLSFDTIRVRTDLPYIQIRAGSHQVPLRGACVALGRAVLPPGIPVA